MKKTENDLNTLVKVLTDKPGYTEVDEYELHPFLKKNDIVFDKVEIEDVIVLHQALELAEENHVDEYLDKLVVKEEQGVKGVYLEEHCIRVLTPCSENEVGNRLYERKEVLSETLDTYEHLKELNDEMIDKYGDNPNY